MLLTCKRILNEDKGPPLTAFCREERFRPSACLVEDNGLTKRAEEEHIFMTVCTDNGGMLNINSVSDEPPK